jgi:hypothetical protein
VRNSAGSGSCNTCGCCSGSGSGSGSEALSIPVPLRRCSVARFPGYYGRASRRGGRGGSAAAVYMSLILTPALRAPVLAVLKKFPACGELFCSGRRPAARAELYSGKAQQPESCLHGGLGVGLSRGKVALFLSGSVPTESTEKCMGNCRRYRAPHQDFGSCREIGAKTHWGSIRSHFCARPAPRPADAKSR